jgi:hypothetical protein
MARNCAACNKPDTIVLDPQERCFPDKCDPKKASDSDITTHWEDCPKLIHDVLLYPRLVQIISVMKPAQPLEAKYLRDGWKPFVDGHKLYREKMLCHDCILIEFERERNHRNYLKACKKARGEDPTYNSILMDSGF